MHYRELLELAARAAGLEVKAAIVLADGTLKGIDVSDGVNTIHYWHPLADDGDALRLAVKLQFDLSLSQRGATVKGWGGRILAEVLCHPDSDGSLECARYAIVRAAAEIGKNTPFPNEESA